MRYQYQSQGFKNDFYGSKNQFKFNAVNLIIIINIIIFFLFRGPFFINHFALIPHNFHIWQLVTYMFLHANIFHLGFNMFLLWMFGKQMESIWGSKKFTAYYLFTGIGSGLLIYTFSSTTIGASGAIMAVLFAYGYTFPNRMILFWFIPMKVKYCILILISIELFQEFSNDPNDNISHVGHLGGMFIGYLYLKFGGNFLKTFFNKLNIKINTVSSKKNTEPSELDVDVILDKLKLDGWESLTEKEKSILFQASKKRRQDSHIN